MVERRSEKRRSEESLSSEGDSSERLQKLMAQAGIGSRRACEALISAGRVTVNGRVAVLGEKADPQRDRILVDGQPLRVSEAPMYIAMYKPRGVLSAVSAPDPRPTVRNLVDLPGRLYPVGRLDVDSEGLILLTNDGELANRLTHPRYGHEKEYRVLVASRPDEEQLQTWRRGVVLSDGYRTAPAEVRMEETFGRGAWLRIILREGRKRQIRETGTLLGLPVVKIIRVRMGALYLIGLKPGEWRHLTPEEIRDLRRPPSPVGRSLRRAPTRRASDGPAAGQPEEGARPPARRRTSTGAASERRSTSGGEGRSGGPPRSRPSGRSRGGQSRPHSPTGRRPSGGRPSSGRPASGRPSSGKPGGQPAHPRSAPRKKPSSK